jgi:hypothetical protein
VFQAGFIIRELTKKFLQRHTGFFFVLFHALNIRPDHPLCQGDNSERHCQPSGPAAFHQPKPTPCQAGPVQQQL